jgi:hypothetical protein
MVVGTPERLWIIGSKKYCKVVEPRLTMPRAAMVLVWMSFWLTFPKSSAKENSWIGASVTLGCLGNTAKKEEVFICKINLKQACETWCFISNFYVPNPNALC